jgi:putative ABC transport system ATP-binding protein
MSWILRVRNLAKSYQDAGELRVVVDDLDLTADAGGVVAVIGPSGSGKSTLLNLLAGILDADSGEIELRLAGQTFCYSAMNEAARTKLRRRHIGYVFQFFNLVPTLTVRENVLLPLELNSLDELQSDALSRLENLGLADRQNDFPAHLSGGERQRTAIARALAHQPTLILADEPTGNLDVDNAGQVAELLIREVKAVGSTLVIATHNEAIARRADQVVRLGS